MCDAYTERVGLFPLSITGSYGAGVTIISEGQEMLDMQNIEHQIATHILPLPGQITVLFRQVYLNVSPPYHKVLFFSFFFFFFYIFV